MEHSTQSDHAQGALINSYYELLKAEAITLSQPMSAALAKQHADVRDAYYVELRGTNDEVFRRHADIVHMIHTRDVTRRFPVLSDEFDRRFPEKKR